MTNGFLERFDLTGSFFGLLFKLKKKNALMLFNNLGSRLSCYFILVLSLFTHRKSVQKVISGGNLSLIFVLRNYVTLYDNLPAVRSLELDAIIEAQ
jgi:hypothetical protein